MSLGLAFLSKLGFATANKQEHKEQHKTKAACSPVNFLATAKVLSTEKDDQLSVPDLKITVEVQKPEKQTPNVRRLHFRSKSNSF